MALKEVGLRDSEKDLSSAREDSTRGKGGEGEDGASPRNFTLEDSDGAENPSFSFFSDENGRIK